MGTKRDQLMRAVTLQGFKDAQEAQGSPGLQIMAALE